MPPARCKNFNEVSLERLRALIPSQKVVGIGEVGLDYYRELSQRNMQQHLFASFIRQAEESNLPVVIHTRQAEDDTLAIAREQKLKRAIVHCFSGDERFMRACLDMGFYVSFTCNITYKKSQTLRELIKLVPLDRFCLETDSPYLSPEGHRGMRNEPMHVHTLAMVIAGLRGMPFEEVCRLTTQNALNFFLYQLKNIVLASTKHKIIMPQRQKGLPLNIRTIDWAGNAIKIIDQTSLPAKLRYIYIKDVHSLWHAIKKLQVRGAPRLGPLQGLAYIWV